MNIRTGSFFNQTNRKAESHSNRINRNTARSKKKRVVGRHFSLLIDSFDKATITIVFWKGSEEYKREVFGDKRGAARRIIRCIKKEGVFCYSGYSWNKDKHEPQRGKPWIKNFQIDLRKVFVSLGHGGGKNIKVKEIMDKEYKYMVSEKRERCVQKVKVWESEHLDEFGRSIGVPNNEIRKILEKASGKPVTTEKIRRFARENSFQYSLAPKRNTSLTVKAFEKKYQRFYSNLESKMIPFLENGIDMFFRCFFNTDETSCIIRSKTKNFYTGDWFKASEFQNTPNSSSHITFIPMISPTKTISRCFISNRKGIKKGVRYCGLYRYQGSGFINVPIFNEFINKSIPKMRKELLRLISAHVAFFSITLNEMKAVAKDLASNLKPVLLIDEARQHKEILNDDTITNKIDIIEIPSKTTAILQPLDLSAFSVLKRKLKNNVKGLRKSVFDVIDDVDEVWDTISKSDLRAGFERMGLVGATKFIKCEEIHGERRTVQTPKIQKSMETGKKVKYKGKTKKVTYNVKMAEMVLQYLKEEE